MSAIAKMLMTAGAILFIVGAGIYLGAKFGLPFGKMPGDVSYEGKNFKVFAPITSMILVSVVLTIILNLISRFGK